MSLNFTLNLHRETEIKRERETERDRETERAGSTSVEAAICDMHVCFRSQQVLSRCVTPYPDTGEFLFCLCFSSPRRILQKYGQARHL